MIPAKQSTQGNQSITSFNRQATLDLICFCMSLNDVVCEMMGLGLGAWTRGVGHAAWRPALLGPSFFGPSVNVISNYFRPEAPGLGAPGGFGFGL